MNRVRVRTGATAATANNVVAAVWNPHASMRLTVYEISLFASTAPAAGAGVILRRTSTTGTRTAVALTQGNATDYTAAASSGATADHTYTAQPTLIAGELWAYPLAAVVGSGFVQPFPEGLAVPPGTGLALVNLGAVITPASDVSFVFDE